MKGFVKQSIDREFGSKPASVSCKYLRKEEVALAPDSWNYDCAATMADGKKYIDKVICFDAPPMKNYEGCGDEDGYPRKPLRAIPGG